MANNNNNKIYNQQANPNMPGSANPTVPNAGVPPPNRNQTFYNNGVPQQQTSHASQSAYHQSHYVNNRPPNQQNRNASAQQQQHHHSNRSHHHQQQQQQQPYQQKASTDNASNHSSSSNVLESIDLHILETTEYPFCTDHSKYENMAKIGQGTFGEVYKARCRKTNEIVALKKVLTENEKEGFPITALREIKILQVLRHDNIVRLIEICTSKANAANKFKSNFFLVFEFCEHDLAGLLSNPQVKFSLGEQKKIMQQLLNGLYYIHKNYILHRDMKTANILVTKDGKLKLADFGLARAIEQQKSDAQLVRYTNRVVTLWYRPPELLLGERCYNRAIDMWGAGCIMAELWTREPILKGNTEQNQLELIQNMCGSITTEVWPEVERLELFGKSQLKSDLKRRIRERLGSYIKDVNALDLLDKLLTLDPKKRIDSDEALDHDFFWTDPLPIDLKLEKLSNSMFEYTAQSFKRNQFNRQPAKPVVNEQHYDRVY